MQQDLGTTLKFLARLRENNDREWFEARRGDYKAARSAFACVVASLLSELGAAEDFGGASPNDCIFRIYRDVRFSKDKTPYKPNMGALMGKGGRRAGHRGYYLHVEPSGSFLAGGLYDPSGSELSAMRAAIAADSRPLKRIVGSAEFRREFGSISGDSLKTAPSGYPKDHPDIELLRLKQLTAMRRLSDDELIAPDFIPRALDTFAAMRPFLRYLAKVVD
jgi:TIGR02453 family protein